MKGRILAVAVTYTTGGLSTEDTHTLDSPQTERIDIDETEDTFVVDIYFKDGAIVGLRYPKKDINKTKISYIKGEST